MDKYVVIGTNAGWSVATAIVRSLINAFIYGFDFEVSYIISSTTCVERAATDLILEARRLKATHIMMVDSDVEFSPWAIQQLAEHDKMVVGAAYNFKKSPPLSTVVLFGADDDKPHPTPDELPKEVFKCSAVPGGFMLINMKVFDAISPPYYVNSWGVDHDMTTCDIYFCNKVRAAGMDVWCDPTIPITHIGLCGY